MGMDHPNLHISAFPCILNVKTLPMTGKDCNMPLCLSLKIHIANIPCILILSDPILSYNARLPRLLLIQ